MCYTNGDLNVGGNIAVAGGGTINGGVAIVSDKKHTTNIVEVGIGQIFIECFWI